MRTAFHVAVTAALAASASAAHAGPLQAIKDYNLIAFSDTKLSSSIEGAVYVDGNLNTGSVQVASKGTNAGGTSLVVTGAVTNNPKVKTGDAYVGAGSSKIDFQGGGGSSKTIKDLPGGLFAQADFVDLSKSLSMLDAHVTYDRYSPGDHMNGFVLAPAVPGDKGISVISLSADFVPETGKIRVAGGSDALDTIIINVAGAEIEFRGWQAAGTALADKIIWNFSEATQVNFREQSWGTVLAPNAQVKTNSQMYGAVVADSVALGGSLRLPLYGGDFAFPEIPDTGGNNPIPEPSSLALAAAGLGILAWRARRRRRAA